MILNLNINYKMGWEPMKRGFPGMGKNMIMLTCTMQWHSGPSAGDRERGPQQ